jgi:hypothetical protein
MTEEFSIKLDEIILPFGDKLAEDLKESFDDALRSAGRKGVQETNIRFNPKYKVVLNTGQIEIKVLALDRKGAPAKYWSAVEHGRGANKKPPPSSALGKDWQVSAGILDPVKVLINIHNNSLKKAKSLSTKRRALRGKIKGLSFDAATKQLSYLIARSIGKKGIKPKPFIDRVLNDGRIDKLTKDLADLFRKDITIELTRPEGIKQT